MRTQSSYGRHSKDGYGHDQLPSDRIGYPDGHQDGPGQLSKERSVLRPHLLPELPHRARMVRNGCLAAGAELGKKGILILKIPVLGRGTLKHRKTGAGKPDVAD